MGPLQRRRRRNGRAVIGLLPERGTFAKVEGICMPRADPLSSVMRRCDRLNFRSAFRRRRALARDRDRVARVRAVAAGLHRGGKRRVTLLALCHRFDALQSENRNELLHRPRARDRHVRRPPWVQRRMGSREPAFDRAVFTRRTATPPTKPASSAGYSHREWA